MKTINLSENRAWNLIKSTLYSLQVIIITIAIPLLAYIELSHVEKPEVPAVKSSVSADKTDPVAYTFIKI